MSTTDSFDLQPPRPAWGISLPTRKSRTTARPIRTAALPARVLLALETPGGTASPLVATGEQVLTGQPVARTLDGLELHASISGTVIGLLQHPVADGRGAPVTCLEIEGDGQDLAWPGLRPGDPHSARPEEVLADIASAGLLGLGGARFPTALKLMRVHGGRLLLLNGVECEPYISCDEMLMRERANDVVEGARIMLRASGLPRCIIAVKNSTVQVRVALRDALEAAGDPRLSLAQVTSRYPAGGERQLVEMITGEEVPAGGLPTDIGCICQNVATAAALASFYRTGRPLISRIITLTGGAFAEPVNVEARLGTPLAALLPEAGGLREAPVRWIMGGPMMGTRLTGPGLPVTAATNCVIAATAAELPAPAAEQPCIRCGACAEACPARLLPQELLVAGRTGDADLLDRLGLAECIECGACDYVCPSHIPLTEGFANARPLLEALLARREQARHARFRVEARSSRESRRIRQEQSALAERTRALEEHPDADALARLLARDRGS
ncbi:MAG: electron transport complex subunit RsxC [Chromatiales bacterium]|nr:electron transport complex subunit RsxC [Chromatiales bacterium]